jgi:hypothetical protein
MQAKSSTSCSWLIEWPADVVIINPLRGFLLCELKDDQKANEFLRTGFSVRLPDIHFGKVRKVRKVSSWNAGDTKRD